MKKILFAALGLLCATTLVVNAKDKDSDLNWSEAQKVLWKQTVDKYDLNKDNKLSKKETAKISDQDIEKLEKAGLLNPSKKKAKTTTKPSVSKDTNAPANPAQAAPAAPAAAQ